MKKVLVILLGGISLFLAAGFLLPREYHVERSIVIAAEPAAIYETVADFPKPVIAAIHGFCIGGGSELALALLLASPAFQRSTASIVG